MFAKKSSPEQKAAKKTAETEKKTEPQKAAEAKPRAEDLEKTIVKKDLEINGLTEILQRLQAEFENYKKRIEKEKGTFVAFSNAALLKELLPLLDSIETAEKKLSEAKECNKQDALVGMIALKKQFDGILKNVGVTEIKALGEKFDPMKHDCLQQGCDEKKGDEIVLEEFQKGYALNGFPLRHSKVKVNKLPEKKEPEKNQEDKLQEKKAEEKVGEEAQQKK